LARRASGKVPPPATRPAAEAFPELTAREREVLYLNPKTVRNQTSNIFTKLRVVDRAQAIIREA
jgi:DNA-binding NarL/FixJ family response regulator